MSSTRTCGMATRLSQLARRADAAQPRARRHRGGVGQVRLTVALAHAADEVAVRRRDDDLVLALRHAGARAATGTARRLQERLRARRQEHLVEPLLLRPLVDGARG